MEFLWDRLGWHGYRYMMDEPVHAVRDFLYFRFGDFDWPVFNFADVFLVTGAVTLIVQAVYLDAKCPQKTEEASKDKTETTKAETETTEKTVA